MTWVWSAVAMALPHTLAGLVLCRYSSAEILLKKLRYAIHNCKAIDIDAYARTNLPESAAS